MGNIYMAKTKKKKKKEKLMKESQKDLEKWTENLGFSNRRLSIIKMSVLPNLL